MPKTSAIRMNRTRRTRLRKLGRRSKYGLDIAKRICKHISEGVSKEGAAYLSGITASTLFKWQNEILEFSEALEEATAKFEQVSVRRISQAGQRPRHWKANAWMLERKLPQRYGRIDRHVIAEQQVVMNLSDEYIKAVNKALGFDPTLFVPLDSRTEAQKAADAQLEKTLVLPPGKRNPLLPDRDPFEPDDDDDDTAAADSKDNDKKKDGDE